MKIKTKFSKQFSEFYYQIHLKIGTLEQKMFKNQKENCALQLQSYRQLLRNDENGQKTVSITVLSTDFYRMIFCKRVPN